MKRLGRSGFSAGSALVAVLWLTYPLVFDILHDGILNDMAAAYVVLPAFVSVWIYRLRAAYIVAAAMLPLHMVLFWLEGHGGGWDLFADVAGFFGLIALALGTLAFGLAVERLHTTETRLANTDRHVSAVAHELRNPLAGVLGLAQTLTDTWDELEPDEARAIAGMIADEARTLSAIIGDLLDMGRVRRETLSLATEEVDLGRLVARIVPLPVVSGEPKAWADPLRVGQIVRNLVANAQAHGGPPIEVAVWSDDDAAFVEVRDAGRGVSPELEPRLFLPFVSRGGPGSTGLGLWLSRALAEAMGGSLEYDRSGGRTRFRLTLPRHQDGRRPARPHGLVHETLRPE